MAFGGNLVIGEKKMPLRMWIFLLVPRRASDWFFFWGICEVDVGIFQMKWA
jgi:hypothetical protein